jgi:hypothetical protein
MSHDHEDGEPKFRSLCPSVAGEYLAVLKDGDLVRLVLNGERYLIKAVKVTDTRPPKPKSARVFAPTVAGK